MPHLIHEMRSSRVPRRFVFVDTEARRERRGGIERQRWRCGVTREVHWQSKESHWSYGEGIDHTDPGELWRAITSAARDDTRTVVVAHNLGYDLRIADAFGWLPRLGWSLEKLVISPEHVGFDAVRGKQRLVFVDSTTVLPSSLDALGDLLGVVKLPLPADDAPDAAWLERCQRDVVILTSAYLAVVDRLRTDDLGCWARTGAGIGWNTYLRHFVTEKVLVHEIEEVRAIEHEAIYGGRNEAWRWGSLRGRGWHLFDAELAYANILANETLPAYYQDSVTGATMRHVRRTYPRTRWLVHANVETELPLLPAKDAHGTFYPVGDFSGWWWDAELVNAEDHGATVEVVEAHRYKGAPFLQSWASWVIDRVADVSSPEARVFAVAAKHWQRAVVGRSSMRYGNWDELGEAFVDGVSYTPMLDLSTGIVGACFQAGGRRWESYGRSWADSAIPQVLSAVSAHCRVNLWRAMATAGLGHLAYVDTDGLIVDSDGAKILREAIEAGELAPFRDKGFVSRLSVWAPRYVTSPNYTRIAGVSSDRRRTGEHRYTASAWERLPEALSSGHPDEVVVRQVPTTLSADDWHRIHLPGGFTAPYHVRGSVRAVEAA